MYPWKPAMTANGSAASRTRTRPWMRVAMLRSLIRAGLLRRRVLDRAGEPFDGAADRLEEQREGPAFAVHPRLHVERRGLGRCYDQALFAGEVVVGHPEVAFR